MEKRPSPRTGVGANGQGQGGDAGSSPLLPALPSAQLTPSGACERESAVAPPLAFRHGRIRDAFVWREACAEAGGAGSGPEYRGWIDNGAFAEMENDGPGSL